MMIPPGSRSASDAADSARVLIGDGVAMRVVRINGTVG